MIPQSNRLLLLHLKRNREEKTANVSEKLRESLSRHRSLQNLSCGTDHQSLKDSNKHGKER